MMGNGSMIKLQVKDHIITTMELSIKASGLTISNMAMEHKFGLMEVGMKEIMIWEKRVERVNMFGKMGAIMMVIGLIIK